MKIVVFGVGKYYKKRKKNIPEDIEIVAFIDNNSKVWGNTINGIKIYNPNQIFQFQYDRILLMSLKIEEMQQQLLEMGVPSEKIWYWNLFYGDVKRGFLQLYGKTLVQKSACHILFIATRLSYDGSSMAAVYAVEALKKRGYSVVLAAPSGNDKFIEEIKKKGIVIVICPSLYCIHEEELIWIKQFDMVIVNTFVMIASACELSKEQPVLWWIHECSDMFDNAYSHTRKEFRVYDNKECFQRINIYAVSKIAKWNFNDFYSERIKKLLPYGIPDNYLEVSYKQMKSKKIIFAIIGSICIRKAQQIFIDAVKMLNKIEKDKMEAWIIGYIGLDSYSNMIKSISEIEPCIKILGELSRVDMDKAYEQIDVIVCPSMEETMSIVTTEGMMYGKLCIVSDRTGMADYIKEGENGFICKVGDVVNLYEKIRYIIHNREKLLEIGKRARKTYEEYFTMDRFEENLNRCVLETIKEYE